MNIKVDVSCKPENSDYRDFNTVMQQLFIAGKEGDDDDLSALSSRMHVLMEKISQRAFDEGRKFEKKPAT